MKRIIMMIAAFAVAGTAVAQTPPMDDAELQKAIVGKYTSKNTESNPGGSRVTKEDVDVYGEDGTYSSDSKITFRMTIPAQQGGGSIYVEIGTKMSGTYTIENGIIIYTVNPDTFEGEVIDTGGGEYDDMIADQFMDSIETQRDAFDDPEKAEELKDHMKTAIVSINDKQMVLQDPQTKKKIVHKRAK